MYIPNIKLSTFSKQKLLDLPCFQGNLLQGAMYWNKVIFVTFIYLLIRKDMFSHDNASALKSFFYHI